MEKEIKQILYVVCENGIEYKKNQAFPIFRYDRTYAYAYGKNQISRRLVRKGQVKANGALQIFCCKIPERPDQGVWYRKTYWERKKWQKCLELTVEKADQLLPNAKVVYADSVRERFDRENELFPEILAATLYLDRKTKDFSHVFLILPTAYGGFMTEMIEELLSPYLFLVNQITFLIEAGAEEEEGNTLGLEELEKFFYEEYGILSDYRVAGQEMGIRTREAVCINLSDSEEIAENSVNHILRFLDSTIKSSYNTKVD